MNAKKIRKLIDRDVGRVFKGETVNDVNAARFLLASAIIGPNADRIGHLLDLPRAYVRAQATRARRGKIWRGHRVVGHEWFGRKPGHGYVALMCDVMVLQGLLQKV